VFLAMIGFFLSRYMAAFQLGHISYPWDPFFGESTRRVLTSDISKAFPVSDAGLGALSCAFYKSRCMLRFLMSSSTTYASPMLSYPKSKVSNKVDIVIGVAAILRAPDRA